MQLSGSSASALKNNQGYLLNGVNTVQEADRDLYNKLNSFSPDQLTALRTRSTELGEDVFKAINSDQHLSPVVRDLARQRAQQIGDKF